MVFGLTTPVLLGIAAGGSVFVGTLIAVYFLLRYGGSFDRMKQEAQGMPNKIGEEKPLLYDKLLETAKKLQRKPDPLMSPLQGDLVWILNYNEKDTEALYQISNGTARGGIYGEAKYNADEMIWRYLDHGPFDTLESFQSLWCKEKEDSRHFVLADASSKLPIGMISLSDHSGENLRIAISGLWITPHFQGTHVLGECIYLMLDRLFSMSYRRVEFKVDGHNVRARRAAHSLGFTFEGVQRKHRIVKDSNCDTVMFAATNSDWGAIKDQLGSRIQAAVEAARAIKAEEKKKELESKKKK